MKNKLIKITMLIGMMIILFGSCNVYAKHVVDHQGQETVIDKNSEQKEEEQNPYEDLKNKLNDPINYPEQWGYHSTATNEPELVEKAGKILGIVNVVGVIASVIALLVIGLKYMMGSVEEKANYKQELIPYVLGAIFLFTSTTIANFIYIFATNI